MSAWAWPAPACRMACNLPADLYARRQYPSEAGSLTQKATSSMTRVTAPGKATNTTLSGPTNSEVTLTTEGLVPLLSTHYPMYRHGRILKFECLARMIDEKGQPVSPAQFSASGEGNPPLSALSPAAMIEQCFCALRDNHYEFFLGICHVKICLIPTLCT